MAGVVIPEGQRRGNETATPYAVLGCIPLQPVLVRFADGAGVVKNEIWYACRQTGQVFSTPNAETHAQDIERRPVKPLLADRVLRQLELIDPTDAVTEATAAVHADTQKVDV